MHKLSKGLLIGLGALALLAVALYLLRNPLATRVAAFMLERNREMECTHPDIRISSALNRVTLSPFECQVHKPGPMKYFKADSEVVLSLEWFRLTHLYVPRATMEQRERKLTHVESNTLGDVANLAGILDGMMKGMLDASESFSPGGPTMEADTFIGMREGKVESVMRGFRRSYEHGWERQQAARIEGGGDELIAMRNFDMRVNKTRGTLSLAVHFGKPKRGEEPDMKLKLEAKDLDQKTPYVRMSL